MAARFELVFISTPAVGNLVPTVEFAQLLINHDPRFSATILIIPFPEKPIINTYVQSRASTATNLRFLQLPSVDPPPLDQSQSSTGLFSLLAQKHKPHVKDAILKLTQNESNSDSVRLAGLFVDMFTTAIIDVASEIGVPCYLFFASPASFFGFQLHLASLDSQLAAELLDSGSELVVPSFKNPVPQRVLPPLVLERGNVYSWLLSHAGRFRETKGVVINTIQELEPHALDSLSHLNLPPVYPIGPVLDFVGFDPDPAHLKHISEWLDQQPPSSVVFLCFGSMGSLTSAQVKEIAIGLERAGLRFLWALREPPKSKLNDPNDFSNLEDVLPIGFLERTAEIGLVCGWVPQVQILAHKAIGGFVSHCGWNSILESLWYGVPIATWPIYAEQHLNAFEMVKELGLALVMRLDYRKGDLVCAEEVERVIRNLMDGGDDQIRTKVKEMKEKCRVAKLENGSSHKNLMTLIEELTATA
ncbi:hypothetical protein L6164_033269 [Bauhinia variegata]|uniref:Uncharacterized protein n=2 Tax=Bauhinia variegata TaxID=167791 RepID=A0ACB9KRB3_BAUVA|nr:hypothetical protein L6164_033269 [Bauhinia variegata]